MSVFLVLICNFCCHNNIEANHIIISTSFNQAPLRCKMKYENHGKISPLQLSYFYGLSYLHSIARLLAASLLVNEIRGWRKHSSKAIKKCEWMLMVETGGEMWQSAGFNISTSTQLLFFSTLKSLLVLTKEQNKTQKCILHEQVTSESNLDITWTTLSIQQLYSVEWWIYDNDEKLSLSLFMQIIPSCKNNASCVIIGKWTWISLPCVFCSTVWYVK